MATFEFYTYFAEGREYFVYKDLTVERPRTIEKDFPFLESLLRFIYLDIWPMENLFKQMDDAVLNFYQDQDSQSQEIVIATLEKLAKKHIYFKFLFLDWRLCFIHLQQNPNQDAQKILPHKRLRHIPSNIDTLQKQIMRLFEDVLDIDDGKKKSAQEKLQAYLDKEKTQLLYAYKFQPISTVYERTGKGTFAEVLHPTSMTSWSFQSASVSSANSVCVSAPTAESISLSPGATRRSFATLL